MKDREKRREPIFLALSVENRNKATTLLADIKAQLARDHPLKDLGLKVHRWENLCLAVFLSRPKKYYLRLINGESRGNVSRRNLIEQIDAIYALFKKPSTRLATTT